MQYETKHTKYTQINTNKTMHSEMGPVWQNPTQRTVRTTHLSVHCSQLTYTIQHRTVLIISLLTSRQTSQLTCCRSLWTTLYNLYMVHQNTPLKFLHFSNGISNLKETFRFYTRMFLQYILHILLKWLQFKLWSFFYQTVIKMYCIYSLKAALQKKCKYSFKIR